MIWLLDWHKKCQYTPKVLWFFILSIKSKQSCGWCIDEGFSGQFLSSNFKDYKHAVQFAVNHRPTLPKSESDLPFSEGRNLTYPLLSWGWNPTYPPGLGSESDLLFWSEVGLWPTLSWTGIRIQPTLYSAGVGIWPTLSRSRVGIWPTLYFCCFQGDPMNPLLFHVLVNFCTFTHNIK